MKRMRAGRLTRAIVESHDGALDGEASSMGSAAEGSIASHQPFRSYLITPLPH